ncbi:MAG: peptidyl-prolyl cis-trans isomerase [Elusimicrobia bacterium]|nr:peptidyl-prolyl cis-trans isomerase [Elusimicrobiota bacterium]
MNAISASLALLMAASARAAAPVPDAVLVRVNGVPIRRSEVVARLLKRYGPQTVDDMIDEILLRQAAKKEGIKPDEAELNRRLKKLESQFSSRRLFLSQLQQAGSSVAKLQDQLADELVREELVVKAAHLTVTDAELKEAFAKNKDRLGDPEEIHLRHILVKTQDEADKIVAEVKKGADFGKLAREHSLAASGKASGGDYGFVPRGMLPDEIDQIAFAMSPGDIRTVPGPRGVHILQVLAKKPAKPAVYAEVKDDLREMLLSKKIQAAAPDYLAGLRRKADIQTADASPAP